ncbi:MAG TPA: hypothetical protein VIH09_01575 [Flavobacterium sp.]
MILKPFSPNRFAYFVHCNSISVSVKASVGKWSSSFTNALLLSSSAFFARILDNEKAETFGPVENESSVFAGSTETGLLSDSCATEVCIVFAAGITATGIVSVAFVLSAIE